MSGGEVAGVLGGTFDPVHLGHLGIARRVRRALGLDRVLLMPSRIPPHKSRPDITAPRHRVAMLRLALARRRGLELCTLELERDRVGYTIDALRRLRRREPGLVPVFIMGLDSLLELHTWRAYRRLLRDFDLIVVDRPGEDSGAAHSPLEPAIRRRVRTLAGGAERRAARDGLGRGGRIYHLPLPPIAISSSEIRRRVANGRSIAGLVPPAVARYIQATGLYRREDES